MTQSLAAAPDAQVAHGALGYEVSLTTCATVRLDRWPMARCSTRRQAGGHLDTPHVPHIWEAHALYEESTGTLLCERTAHQQPPTDRHARWR
jgi:hypothetical protein